MSTELASKPQLPPNPKRQAAGRRNRALRGELTPSGIERLRAAALSSRPWLSSTGPRTAAGKARSATNGASRQIGPVSIRLAKAIAKAVQSQVLEMRGVVDRG